LFSLWLGDHKHQKRRPQAMNVMLNSLRLEYQWVVLSRFYAYRVK
jgi:hypothetical protein